jgi:hypothetical protein
LATAPAATVTLAIANFPGLATDFAVTMQLPSAIPITSPTDETLATSGALETHVTFCDAPPVVLTFAVSITLSPTSIAAPGGDTVIDFTVPVPVPLSSEHPTAKTDAATTKVSQLTGLFARGAFVVKGSIPVDPAPGRSRNSLTFIEPSSPSSSVRRRIVLSA